MKKKEIYAPRCSNLLNSATCMDVKSILHKKFVLFTLSMNTVNDKLEITMPKQIDVKVTKPQNKHGHGRTRKCHIENLQSMIGRIF